MSPTGTEAYEGPRSAVPLDWAAAMEAVRRRGPRLATWVLPFSLVVYLGLQGGGYDAIVRSEVGVALGWIILVGALGGILPTAGLRRLGWLGVGLLGGFAAWTGLGIIWSPSSEAGATEFARVATYFGVFVLVLSARSPGDMRRLVNGLASGIAVLGVLALLSRLHPSWFPADHTADALGFQKNRLSYPLGYWNGMGALVAMGLPLLLFAAIRSRTIAGRALAAAAIPAVVLAGMFTLSRGGALEAGVALTVFAALAPRRLSLLAGALPAAAGSLILVLAALQRDDLSNGIQSAAAEHQGNEILAMAIVVCGGVALLQVALALASRYRIVPRVKVPRTTAIPATAIAAVLAIGLALAAGVPGELGDRWEEFKTPEAAGTGVARFDSAKGGGRYQAWTSAGDANDTKPLVGIGPGGFESWWAQNGTLPIFIRDAHSLYMQTLGELGVIGLFLIGGFIFIVLAAGALRSFEERPDRRWPYAAATASVAAFASAAAIDWAWELSVLPVIFIVLAGGILASRRYKKPGDTERFFVRGGLIGLSVLALVAITVPLLAAKSVRASQEDAASGDLDGALDSARHAHSLQPYAASPLLQEALVLELQGDFGAAAASARDASAAASHDWRTWLVLSRTEAEAGDAAASVAAYRRARSLNPRSPLFAANPAK
jgi:hypothetical protein